MSTFQTMIRRGVITIEDAELLGRIERALKGAGRNEFAERVDVFSHSDRTSAHADVLCRLRPLSGDHRNIIFGLATGQNFTEIRIAMGKSDRWMRREGPNALCALHNQFVKVAA